MLGSLFRSINGDALITVAIVGAGAFGLVKYAGRVARYRVPLLEYAVVEDPNELGYTLVALDGHRISTAELVCLDRAIDVAHDTMVEDRVDELVLFERELKQFLGAGGFKRTPEAGWFE